MEGLYIEDLPRGGERGTRISLHRKCHRVHSRVCIELDLDDDLVTDTFRIVMVTYSSAMY